MTRTAIVLTLLAAGCSTFSKDATSSKARRVGTHDEAGSAHFAVLSVAPWHAYADAMQPNFDLTADKALEMAIGTTKVSSQHLLDVLEVAVRAQKNKGGAYSNAPPTAMSAVPGRAPMPKADVGGDPMLGYWTALALYQEVQLLNRYVQDAAVRHGYRPYVVRLQVSLMPRARNEPYDAYSTISFFAAEPGAATPSTGVRGAGGKAKKEVVFAGGPQVLPLMVTDNLEAAQVSRQTTSVRQLAAAIGFLSPKFDASADMNKLRSNLESVLGTDLNALLTVARLSDNTLRVRLGAMQQGSSEYAMVPRNHNVTLLLMVPATMPGTLQVVSRTTLVDAESGEELRDRTEDEVREKLAAVSERYKLGPGGVAKLERLLPLAQGNRQALFFQELGPHARGTSLWLDLVSVMVGSQYAGTVVDLPAHGDSASAELFPEQAAPLIDDGKQCKATLSWGYGLRRAQLGAMLVVQSGDEELRLAAERVDLVDGGTRAHLIFPSVAGLQIEPKGLSLLIAHGELTQTYKALYRKP